MRTTQFTSVSPDRDRSCHYYSQLPSPPRWESPIRPRKPARQKRKWRTSRSPTSIAGRASLDDYKDKKAIVVAFVDTECPLSNLYVPTLIDLHKDYSGKGVQFLAVNSSRQDSFVRMSAHAQERAIPFPVLKDFDQKVADALGAKRTPEVFLLDSARMIRYRGRIDDQYGIGFRRDKPTQQRPPRRPRRSARGQGKSPRPRPKSPAASSSGPRKRPRRER